MYDTLILADRILKLVAETGANYSLRVSALQVALNALPAIDDHLPTKEEG